MSEPSRMRALPAWTVRAGKGEESIRQRGDARVGLQSPSRGGGSSLGHACRENPSGMMSEDSPAERESRPMFRVRNMSQQGLDTEEYTVTYRGLIK